MFDSITSRGLSSTIAIAGVLCMTACGKGRSGPDDAGKASTDKADAGKAETKQATPEIADAKPAKCEAAESWVTKPSPPADVGDGNVADQTNCQFYQFAWQWFLSLASPTTGGERGFETDLRVFQPNVQDQCKSEAKKGRQALLESLSVRTAKSKDAASPQVVPAELAQATGNPLYAQVIADETQGRVVLYTISYSDNECEATAAGYLPNTIETKLSWRQLAPNDPQLSTYYNVQAVVEEISPDPITLGLVGFHLVINTATHPEFIWATWEHKSNAPDCDNPGTAPAGGWSFTSADCATCLAGGGVANCGQCNFNSTTDKCTNTGTPCALTGTPDEVCRVFPDGTDPGSTTNGNDNDLNRDNIDQLNAQLVGPEGILTKLSGDNPMAVWKNYELVGGLWTNGGVGSGGDDVQRGSLELANTTMETFGQVPGFNCFSCHAYNPDTPLTVSHIESDLGIPLTN